MTYQLILRNRKPEFQPFQLHGLHGTVFIIFEKQVANNLTCGNGALEERERAKPLLYYRVTEKAAVNLQCRGTVKLLRRHLYWYIQT